MVDAYPMLTLLVARHGNTFDRGATVLRIGQRTDLPLSESGQQQARALGQWLSEKYPIIDRVIVSTLQRTQQTARWALPHLPFEIYPMLDEIDYGVDEGKSEAEVIARVGAGALKRWDAAGVPAAGWHVDPARIIQQWQTLAGTCVQAHKKKQVILAITSNGIARFAPYITTGFCISQAGYSLKLNTGALSAFEYSAAGWRLDYWNRMPVSG